MLAFFNVDDNTTAETIHVSMDLEGVIGGHRFQTLGEFLDQLIAPDVAQLLAVLQQSVEADMMAGILADGLRFSEEGLRRRAESVNNVKRTNGRISLEKYAQEGWEDEDERQD